MIQKRKIPDRILELAKIKMKEAEVLHVSYTKVLNYQRWTINEDTQKDIRINSDFFEQLNKIYIGNVKNVSRDITKLLEQFGNFTYKFIRSKECMFVDFDNPNAAYLCIRELKGLKIGRTPSYPSEIPEQYKHPDKSILYLSNIHQDVSEEILIDLFPEVEYVRMSYNGNFKHNGYCYIKFRNNKVVPQILRFYSNLTLYNQRVYMCNLVVKMDLPIFKTPNLPDEVYKIKKAIDNKIFKKGKILILRNLLDLEDYDEDFKNEMKRELSKHGIIENLEFTSNEEIIVRCVYKTETECKQAHKHLNGRFFGGRRINAEIIET
ncbi:Poly(U)-binding-splicing factor half pint [Nosema granulosis]|uniref:Poly(U)-binding-splicing factor half pint n=1 Tax=Nosema granulosis TaxID=83296 RepID=A0A9P6H366_9MICR|nr:Poly(U)-binding-splicing factor half pint [Nosema granulosis]